MYVDESGDIGVINSPTRYFVLSGLVVHELRWQAVLDQLINFRQRMRVLYGLKLREELHASHLINKPGELRHIKRNDRLSIIRALTTELATIQDLRLINIVIDKQGKSVDFDVFGKAWQALIQRFENTLRRGNFPGVNDSKGDRGLLLPDRTDDKKLKILLRKMRRYNPIPSKFSSGNYRQLPLSHIIEDPNFKDSSDSYLIQCVDLSAYLLQQHLLPNSYMKKTGGQNYFLRLDPILCKVAGPPPYGIVKI
jgi:Protein of unknown function (DUF3800)